MSGMIPVLLSVDAAAPEGSIINLNTQLLVDLAIQWINIIVLVVVLYYMLYKPVKKFMTERAARIQGQLDHAAEEEQRAEALRGEYEAKLSDIGRERDEAIQKGHEIAMQRSDTIIAEARREANSIHRKALEEIRIEQENQQDDMKRAIIDISVKLAGRYVQLSIDEETQNAYVERALQNLEDALWEE